MNISLGSTSESSSGRRRATTQPVMTAEGCDSAGVAVVTGFTDITLSLFVGRGMLQLS